MSTIVNWQMGGGTNAVSALVAGLFTTLHHCTLHSRWTSKVSYGIKQLLTHIGEPGCTNCAEYMVSTAQLQALVWCKMKRQITFNRFMLSVCMLTDCNVIAGHYCFPGVPEIWLYYVYEAIRDAPWKDFLDVAE